MCRRKGKGEKSSTADSMLFEVLSSTCPSWTGRHFLQMQSLTLMLKTKVQELETRLGVESHRGQQKKGVDCNKVAKSNIGKETTEETNDQNAVRSMKYQPIFSSFMHYGTSSTQVDEGSGIRCNCGHNQS